MPEQVSRIYLVDDHPLVREWLGALIALEPDLAVCGGADDVEPALAGLAEAKPDLVIIDLGLKGSSGLDLIKSVRTLYPDIRIVVLSMHEETSHAERAIRAGAQAYVMKTESTENVIAAIREVVRGKLYLSERVTKLFVNKFVCRKAPEFGTSIELLSDRELEVFHLLGQGFQAREIAVALNLSAKTVHSYCGRIREKLNLPNSTQLLMEAVRWNEGSAA